MIRAVLGTLFRFLLLRVLGGRAVAALAVLGFLLGRGRRRGRTGEDAGAEQRRYGRRDRSRHNPSA